MTGALSFQKGLAAEDQVWRHYKARGLGLAARRWRGQGGEIDLILRDGAGMVFVEVKCSGTFAEAADQVSDRQADRIRAAATEFVADEPLGQDTAMRFDVALVDRQGRIEIREAALWS